MLICLVFVCLYCLFSGCLTCELLWCDCVYLLVDGYVNSVVDYRLLAPLLIVGECVGFVWLLC